MKSKTHKMVLGVVYAFIIWIAFIIIDKGVSIDSIKNTLFVTLFSLVAPFIALFKSYYYAMGVISFVVIGYAQYRYAPEKILEYSIMITVILWMLFGTKSLILFTGGA